MRRRLALSLSAAAVVLGIAAAAAVPPVPGLDQMASAERARVESVVKNAFATTRVELDPYATRRDVWEYMLDHPEFATYVTRALKLGRYRVWQEDGVLRIDDGWGVKGRFTIVHAEPGKRIAYGRGSFAHGLLPEIHGVAVATLEYAFQPGGDGRTAVVTVGTAFVQTDNRAINALGRLAAPIVQNRADSEARRLLRMFSKASRALEEDPAQVYRLVSEQPDVPRRELEDFRRMLGLR